MTVGEMIKELRQYRRSREITIVAEYDSSKLQTTPPEYEIASIYSGGEENVVYIDLTFKDSR